MAKLNLYKGGDLVKSVDKQKGKTSVTIDNLQADTNYPEGTYTVSFSNESGESEKVKVPEFHTTAVHVVTVTLDVDTLEMSINDTHQLQPTFEPQNVSNKKVTYHSDADSVATVTAEGLIQAKGAGKANITVTTEDGEKTDTVVVTVKEPIPEAPEASSIQVTPGETSAEITV